MIEICLIFLCFFLYFGGKEFFKLMEQKDYEKRRFYLMVQEELDRLDKISKDQGERNNHTRISQWAMRN